FLENKLHSTRLLIQPRSLLPVVLRYAVHSGRTIFYAQRVVRHTARQICLARCLATCPVRVLSEWESTFMKKTLHCNITEVEKMRRAYRQHSNEVHLSSRFVFC